MLSTWTSALGLGGKDAVRRHYEVEVARLIAECERAVEAPRNEEAFLTNLDQTVANLIRIAREERRGALSGMSGSGPAREYLERLSGWLSSVAKSARQQIATEKGGNRSEEILKACMKDGRALNKRLDKIETTNFKKWERNFARAFDKMRLKIIDLRKRATVLTFVEAQLEAMDLSVVPPQMPNTPTGKRVAAQLEAYTDQVRLRLSELIGRFDTMPPRPLPPTPTWSVADLLTSAESSAPSTPKADDGRDIPALQQTSARQAIWQYAYQAFDIWAFALSWDFASYALIIIYVVFPGLDRRQTTPLPP